VRIEIEPAAMEANVPNLILQPLVENAIKHGIEPHARRGLIELRARKENGALRLEIADNGDGLQSTKPSGFGVGLSNTRARLEQLYGAHHRLEMVNGPAGGLLVRLSIPWRTVKVEPAAA
jgi:LytS/YehU family sensor histidine kinase